MVTVWLPSGTHMPCSPQPFVKTFASTDVCTGRFVRQRPQPSSDGAGSTTRAPPAARAQSLQRQTRQGSTYPSLESLRKHGGQDQSCACLTLLLPPLSIADPILDAIGTTYPSDLHACFDEADKSRSDLSTQQALVFARYDAMRCRAATRLLSAQTKGQRQKRLCVKQLQTQIHASELQRASIPLGSLPAITAHTSPT